MNNTQRPSILELDELDLMLIKELEVSARQSYPALAVKLGTTPITVRRRMQRLIDRGTITVNTVPDPVTLGFHMRAFIGINTLPGKSEAAVSRLRSYPSVQSIVLTTGRFDMLLYVVLHDHQELLSFIDEKLGCTPDLVHAETMTVLKLTKASWRYLGGVLNGIEEAIPRNLDESEWMLIKELELHPRKTITDLGKTIGMSRVSASRKLQTLLNQRIIRVVTVPNMVTVGLNVQVAIFVRVRPDKVRAVVDTLTAEKRVRHVAMITGHFDMFVWAAFRDSREMSDYLRNEMDNTPGVIDYEIMLERGIPKRSFSLLTAQ